MNLQELHDKNEAGKGPVLMSHYAAHIEELKDKPIKLLELGVWKDWLGCGKDDNNNNS